MVCLLAAPRAQYYCVLVQSVDLAQRAAISLAHAPIQHCTVLLVTSAESVTQ